MSAPTIEKVKHSSERQLPWFREFDAVVGRIRERAQAIFERRTAMSDTALDDWLRAEREICWPAAELTETKRKFHARVALPGFKAKDIEITATPDRLLVKAQARVHKSKKDKQDKSTVRWSEFHSGDVFRRIDMPSAIDVDKVSADFSKGVLTIKAAKARDSGAEERKIDARADD